MKESMFTVFKVKNGLETVRKKRALYKNSRHTKNWKFCK